MESTLGRGHRIIPSSNLEGHVFAEGWRLEDGSTNPHVTLSTYDALLEKTVWLRLTPACARELALQLTDSAAFCDEAPGFS